MIKQFILILTPFLFLGCGNAENKPNLSNTAPEKDPLEEAVDWAKIQNRNGDAYLPNTDVPYSGWAKRTFENGQVEVLVQFDEGSITKIKRWQENGIPQFEAGFIKGKVNLSIDLSQIKNVGISSLEGTITEWHSNGQKSAENFVKHGKRSGKANAWFENGQISDLLNFKNGKKEGLQKSWYQNGQLRSEENFKDGEKNKISKMWHENGQKYLESNWKSGKAEGEGFSWYPNGQIKFEGNFSNGMRDRTSIEWYPNGQKQSVTNYENGKKSGLHLKWLPNGQLEENATYRNDNLASGIQTKWNDSGVKIKEVFRKDGKLHGLCKEWYDDGQKLSEINFSEGMINGISLKWFPNGQLEVNATYIDGKLASLLKSEWYVNGKPRYVKKIEDDKIITGKSWKPNGKECPITSLEKGLGLFVEYNETNDKYVCRAFLDGIEVSFQDFEAWIKKKLKKKFELLGATSSVETSLPYASEKGKRFFETQLLEGKVRALSNEILNFEIVLDKNPSLKAVIDPQINLRKDKLKNVREQLSQIKLVEPKILEGKVRVISNEIQNLEIALDKNSSLKAVILPQINLKKDKLKNVRAKIIDFNQIQESELLSRISHILISHKDAKNANGMIAFTKEDASMKISLIREIIRQIPTEFEKIAKEHSDCPSKVLGGQLGDLFPANFVVLPFAEKAVSLEAGQISDVIETEFGFHIIKREPVNSIRSSVDASTAKPASPPFFTPPTAPPSQVKP